MNIKKRKLRLIGNSVVISVSTEFLGDFDKLKSNITVFLQDHLINNH